jgi:hypothetical protein
MELWGAQGTMSLYKAKPLSSLYIGQREEKAGAHLMKWQQKGLPAIQEAQ